MNYLPFEPAPWRPQMGLMALKLDDWIEIDDELVGILTHKRRILAARHDDAFAALPATEAAGAEVLTLLAEHLPRRFPTVYPRMGASIAVAATGELIGLGAPGAHPLETAARLVPEDLCLLRPVGDSYVLAAACLCAPSRWRLADKIGRSLADIHAPVPHYDAVLARPVERFFAKLAVDRPVWRLNWTIHDSADLYQPVPPPPRALGTADFADGVFLRVERQTLRRLLQSGDVLFTIRTYIRALGQVAENKRDALRLAGAIEGLPPEMRAYRNMGHFADALAAWLRAAAASDGARRD